MFGLFVSLNQWKQQSAKMTSSLFREITDFDIEDDNPEKMQISDTCAYTKEGWPISSTIGFSQWYDDCQRPYMPE